MTAVSWQGHLAPDARMSSVCISRAGSPCHEKRQCSAAFIRKNHPTAKTGAFRSRSAGADGCAEPCSWQQLFIDRRRFQAVRISDQIGSMTTSRPDINNAVSKVASPSRPTTRKHQATQHQSRRAGSLLRIPRLSLPPRCGMSESEESAIRNRSTRPDVSRDP